MKRVIAIVRPERLSEVKAALVGIGAGGMTVSDVRGAGSAPGEERTWRGESYTVDLLPRTRIEAVVPDHKVEEVVSAVREAARTGQVGDGRIFISPVDRAIRIRDGSLVKG